jgi:pimeloyl-ACP methyl ester carboxylesterase
MLSEVQEDEHRQLGRQGMPVTAIWARDDRTIPITALGRLAEWNRKAHQEVVVQADHALPYTHGPQLFDALREAMRN